MEAPSYCLEQGALSAANEPVYDRPSFGYLDTDFEEMDQLYTSLGIIHFVCLVWDAGRLFHQWDPKSSLTSRNLARDSRYLDASNLFGLCWLDRFFCFSGSQSLTKILSQRASEGWKIWR